MNLSCTRPKLSELMFLVYSRPLHPELFELLRERHIQRETYQASVRITDAGHLVSWQHGSICLSEVLAMARSPLPRKRRLLACRLRGERTETVQCADGVVYQTSLTVERLERSLFARMHDELESDAVSPGLVHNFRPHHRLSPSPLSYIAIEARLGTLLIQAFHTFPDECAIVKIQSLYECDRR